ncbi:MAG TPA: MoxR family ATPase, partial [Bacteroidetes bacterium]|nr:MoxR family ATPase [Bacteroidota bacterium]HEX03574.1 MoxR family ATPase [Bacteroidota bacterium]
MNQDIQAVTEQVQSISQPLRKLTEEVGKILVGQEYMVERLLVGMLADGHVLLEGVPGLAKTLAVKSLASAVDGSFHRIQFTPDLLPADLVGTLIYNPREGTFETKTGPIFAQFILADEINRAPAKVQSALLEAMEEKQVTLGEETHKLPNPFLVLATQNPLEQQGTYPLPEAQLDRFMLKLQVGYPSRAEEKQILRLHSSIEALPEIQPVIKPEDILNARKIVDQVYVDEKIENYVLDIVFATRNPEDHGLENLKELINYGASPRATLFLIKAAKAWAVLQGRAFVIPEDIRSIGHDVLRHRILPSFEAEA